MNTENDWDREGFAFWRESGDLHATNYRWLTGPELNKEEPREQAFEQNF